MYATRAIEPVLMAQDNYPVSERAWAFPVWAV